MAEACAPCGEEEWAGAGPQPTRAAAVKQPATTMAAARVSGCLRRMSCCEETFSIFPYFLKNRLISLLPLLITQVLIMQALFM